MSEKWELPVSCDEIEACGPDEIDWTPQNYPGIYLDKRHHEALLAVVEAARDANEGCQMVHIALINAIKALDEGTGKEKT